MIHWFLHPDDLHPPPNQLGGFLCAYSLLLLVMYGRERAGMQQVSAPPPCPMLL